MRCLLGVNLPYFYGSYGHDLAPSARHPDWPCDFHLTRAYRPLLEARSLGFEAVRVWLCEGGEGLVVDAAGRIEGPHPRLLESIRLLEEGARVAGVRIYWGLLDANAAARDGDPITRSILAERDQAARFAEKVAAPIARALDPGVLVGLEIVNEPEIVTEGCRDAREDQSAPSIGWDALGASIAMSRAAALAEKGELLVTAGTGHVFLPDLWRSGAGLTAIDIHMYHPHGGLPSRSDLATYVGDPALEDGSIPLLAGECGLAKSADDDPLALRNYLYNADIEGYAAAFLWKLEGDLVDARSAARAPTAIAGEVKRVLVARPEGGLRW